MSPRYTKSLKIHAQRISKKKYFINLNNNGCLSQNVSIEILINQISHEGCEQTGIDLNMSTKCEKKPEPEKL